jgi:hypothetical protein
MRTGILNVTDNRASYNAAVEPLFSNDIMAIGDSMWETNSDLVCESTTQNSTVCPLFSKLGMT